MSEFDLSRDERTSDGSGTPNGLMAQAHKQKNLLMADTIDNDNVLVEFVVGKVTRDKTGFSRFVRFRNKVQGKQYGVARQPREF